MKTWDYFWKRLNPYERRQAHEKYLKAFYWEDLRKGFEPYHEVLQLIQRRMVIHTTLKQFDTYIGYRTFKEWPGMELRAWTQGIDFRFKQGASPDRDAADTLTVILSREGIDMHEFDAARFDKNSLPNLERIARDIIDAALYRKKPQDKRP